MRSVQWPKSGEMKKSKIKAENEKTVEKKTFYFGGCGRCKIVLSICVLEKLNCFTVSRVNDYYEQHNNNTQYIVWYRTIYFTKKIICHSTNSNFTKMCK